MEWVLSKSKPSSSGPIDLAMGMISPVHSCYGAGGRMHESSNTFIRQSRYRNPGHVLYSTTRLKAKKAEDAPGQDNLAEGSRYGFEPALVSLTFSPTFELRSFHAIEVFVAAINSQLDHRIRSMPDGAVTRTATVLISSKRPPGLSFDSLKLTLQFA